MTRTKKFPVRFACQIITREDGSMYCTVHQLEVKKCEQCPDRYHTNRSHTLTCSDNCRKTKSRKENQS